MFSQENLSRPIESLIKNKQPQSIIHHVDVLIIGSGYGGSVAAYRLAGPGRSVMVLERGREYKPGDFPDNLGDLPAYVKLNSHQRAKAIGYPDALLNIHHGKGVDILVGSGLGGTSLINASVAIKPDYDLFQRKGWPQEYRNAPYCLDQGFEQISRLLDVTVAPTSISSGNGTATPGKYQALQGLYKELVNNRFASHQAEIAPANVTITFTDKDKPGNYNDESGGQNHRINAVGLPQLPCTHCGNCVTGCNVGAKNTLTMNLIPLAKARGACFYHGASCLTVRQDSEQTGSWLIEVARTTTEKTDYDQETYFIQANKVILAAGTLGSTEILMRSQQSGYIEVSDKLGDSFSTNGDGIAFGYAQQTPVNAIGQSNAHDPESPIGPTINGVLRVKPKGHKQTITIEDSAIPASLSKLFGELAVIAAQLHRIGSHRIPAMIASEKADPLAASRKAKQHSQLLLIMGDDNAAGKITLNANPSLTANQRHVYPDWPDAAANALSVSADQLLSSMSFGPGFDGGQYAPNPFWQLMPESATKVMDGNFPTGRAISVHPLGGCGMGNTINDGVVNHLGQVFRKTSTDAQTDTSDLYDGLYVMDGAILPTAIGVNPFLTISALSWRAAGAILQAEGWSESEINIIPAKVIQAQSAPEPVKAEPLPQEPTVLEFKEQLVGQLTTEQSVPDWFPAMLKALNRDISPSRLFESRGLILNLSFQLNLEEWLESPSDISFTTRGELHVNRIPVQEIELMQRAVADQALCDHTTLIGKFQGTVSLLTREETGFLRKSLRTANALLTYHIRRQSLFSYLRHREKDTHTESGSLWQCIMGFINVAGMHGDYRRMTYSLQSSDGHLMLTGDKRLAFRLFGDSLWNSLLDLPIRLAPGIQSKGRIHSLGVKGKLRVNSISMLDDMLPQIVRMQHSPEMIMDLVRAGGLITRSIIQTHFWSFGAPEYPSEKPSPNLNADPLYLNNGRIVRPIEEKIPVQVYADDPAKETFELRIHSYLQADSMSSPAETIVLVHGLAQGSRIFTTPSQKNNMATYFYQQGYNVWTIDYRLSNLLHKSAAYGGWAIDEIAEFDLTQAISFIHQKVGKPLHIFAHCVGATAATMAILKGWLTEEQISSVTFNAIQPWIIPSAMNRTKAKFGSVIEDWIDDTLLDPIPSKQDQTAVHLIDRLAFTVARLDEEAGDIHSPPGGHDLEQGICDRMTFLYGRMWRHKNLDDATHQEFKTLLGPAPGDVYRHLFYFAKRHHLTNKHGDNVYLKHDNILRFRNIKTLFIHGEYSEVFNPYSATVSAVQFKEVLPQSDIRLKRIPDYGHMDIIFAHHAARDVFPYIASFIKSDSDKDSLQDDGLEFDPIRLSHYHRRLTHSPLTGGPVLKSAWRSGDKMYLRYWIELTSNGLGDVEDAIISDSQGRNFFPVYRDQTGAFQSYDFVIETPDTVEAGDLEKSVLEIKVKTTNRDEPTTLTTLALNDQWHWLKKLNADSARQDYKSFNFLVGSCRYPGTAFEKDASDKVFTSMLDQLALETGPDKVFMIGDQIYADATANLLPSEPEKEQYTNRYREALSSPGLRQLIASVPTHFAIDDHEFSDNWSGLSPGHSDQQVQDYEQALEAARYFLSNFANTDNSRNQSSKQKQLWSALRTEGETDCPVFITDTRSERQFRSATKAAKAHNIMDPETQLPALVEWLLKSHLEHPLSPKFVFSGSVFGLIPKSLQEHPDLWRNEDTWLGYPATLAYLIEVITENQIQNLVFVGGDLHLSAIARLSLSQQGKKPVTAWQIVASGFYSPLPFTATKPAKIDWETTSEISLTGYPEITLTSEPTLLTTHPSHYLSVKTRQQSKTQWGLSLSAIDCQGSALSQVTSLHSWAQENKDGEIEIQLFHST